MHIRILRLAARALTNYLPARAVYTAWNSRPVHITGKNIDHVSVALCDVDLTGESAGMYVLA